MKYYKVLTNNYCYKICASDIKLNVNQEIIIKNKLDEKEFILATVVSEIIDAPTICNNYLYKILTNDLYIDDAVNLTKAQKYIASVAFESNRAKLYLSLIHI